jgi:hypothetical protein
MFAAVILGNVGLPIPEEPSSPSVGLGYAVSYGAGQTIERFVGRAEPVVVAAIALLTLAFIGRRLLRRAPAH